MPNSSFEQQILVALAEQSAEQRSLTKSVTLMAQSITQQSENISSLVNQHTRLEQQLVKADENISRQAEEMRLEVTAIQVGMDSIEREQTNERIKLAKLEYVPSAIEKLQSQFSKLDKDTDKIAASLRGEMKTLESNLVNATHKNKTDISKLKVKGDTNASWTKGIVDALPKWLPLIVAVIVAVYSTYKVVQT